MPALLPIFAKLAGRPCVVVGAGSVAEAKIVALLGSGGEVTVVAPRAVAAVEQLVAAGRIRRVHREFRADDLSGALLAIAATSDPRVNHEVFAESQRLGILCNSVDDPPNCDFYFGSVVQRGDLQVAVSTAGESPSLAQRLRREIEESLDENIGKWVAEIGAQRREILATEPPSEERKQRLIRLAYSESPASRAPGRKNAPASDATSDTASAAAGKVYFVGAGPGDPQLLTIRAHALLSRAVLVLHDALVPEAIVALAPPEAIVLNVGKRCGAKHITQDEINALMIAAARRGVAVIRLKSGDPGIFGRLAEELDALAAAGVASEIVPGVSASSAAAASLGVSLTDRRKGSRLLLVSGHPSRENAAREKSDWSAVASGDTTLAVYMPGHEFARMRDELLAAGLGASTPAALLSCAFTSAQREAWTTLGELAALPALPAPTILLIGQAISRTTMSTAAAAAGSANSESRENVLEAAGWESFFELLVRMPNPAAPPPATVGRARQQ